MEPEFYQFKRYTLTIVCYISIVFCIIFASIAPLLVDEYMEATGQNYLPPGKIYAAIEKLRIRHLILQLGGIVVQIVGLFGAWEEDFCLTGIYTMFQIVGTIRQFWYMASVEITHPTDWISMLIGLLACYVAILFLIDLRIIRNTRNTYQPLVYYHV